MTRTYTYRLPSGKITSNLNNYLKAWRRLCNKVDVVLNSRTIGFDTGILIQYPNSGETENISLTLAKKIAKYAKYEE